MKMYSYLYGKIVKLISLMILVFFVLVGLLVFIVSLDLIIVFVKGYNFFLVVGFIGIVS